jgi:hypothetical protein
LRIANSVANRVQMMNLVRGAAIGWEQTAYKRWVDAQFGSCLRTQGWDVSRSWAWAGCCTRASFGRSLLGGWGDPAVFINDQRKKNSLSESASAQSGLAHQASR